MNPNIMECDDHKLKLLLAADEQAVEHDPWMQHVEHCSHCQLRLRELAAQADDWQKAAEVLAADDEDVPYFGRDHDAPSSWNESMVKQLLEPPSHPEMLGRLGRYEMERMIGCGGMGIVFKAFDTELNRVVAVKLLAPYLAARGSARKRFAREARAAAGVRDDHVVPIFNVESEHEPPFLVMQYVAGGSLQEKLDRDGPLEVAEVLRIGLQTAKGLAAAHAQGLIHRDVKPSNILLDEGVERALLTDFGLARAEDDACLTRSGFHPGTPHYMSPEQVRGEAIDGRSDLFSLGCVLYALCTGHSPFRAETSYAVMRRITDESPRLIREQNANIPEWLEAIVMKLLSKSREDRFASAKEVAELLEDCLAHVHQPATTPLPARVQDLAARAQRRANGVPKPNRLKARHQRIPPIGKFIAAAAGACALIFAGVLIVLELGKGTLRIESELDNVPIRIMQGDKVVDRLKVTKSGNSVRVAAGTYVVEIDGPFHGIDVKDGNVTLGRRGEVVVKILQNADEFLGHDTDIQSTSEDHQYLVWEEDDRVRLSNWFAKAVRVDKETLSSINQLLSETWKRYIKLESQHTTYSRNSGRLIADVSKFTDERQLLESDFWTRLDEIVSGEQRALLHAISTARGDTNGDDTWPYRPKTLPSIIGWHERLFPVRVEIWTKGTWFYWRVSAGEYYVYGDGQTLPAELQHYWTIGNREYGDKLFDTEMKQIDERLAKAVEGSTEYSLLRTKMEQLQQQWDLSVAHVKGMAAAAKVESVSLQGEWEFISVESDGVVTEYKTPRLRLTVAADAWTVQGGGGIETMSSNGHRVEVDGNKLTFHGVTPMMPGLGSNSKDEIPTIGYGLWQVDGDTLTYLVTPFLMKPAVAEGALNGQGQPPIQFPDSFETKGTKNTVYRLRRIQASTPPNPSASTNQTQSKSSPEYPPVKIVVHDEEGNPLKGVRVSLFQAAAKEGGKNIEINATSNENGIAVDRILPFGNYYLTLMTSEGWQLSGNRVNVEFETGLSTTIVAPSPNKRAILVVDLNDKLHSRPSLNALRFGELQEHRIGNPGYSTDQLPEPGEELGGYEFFPTIVNGIEEVAIGVRFEIRRTIKQPAFEAKGIGSEWRWYSPDDFQTSGVFIVTGNGLRWNLDHASWDGKSISYRPNESSPFFKLKSSELQVGGKVLRLADPQPLPYAMDVPAGDTVIFVTNVYGKPTAEVRKSLGWVGEDRSGELWLPAPIQFNSKWLSSIVATETWTPRNYGDGYNTLVGHLLRQQRSIKPGETIQLDFSEAKSEPANLSPSESD